jgi:hypothetical protein
MAGQWELVLTAAVPGEPAPVTGKVIYNAKDGFVGGLVTAFIPIGVMIGSVLGAILARASPCRRPSRGTRPRTAAPSIRTLLSTIPDQAVSGKFAVDSALEESGFEPLVPLATEMLIELVRGNPNATRMLAVGDIGPVPRLG